MSSAARGQHPKYAVHPGVRMVQDWIVSLKSKTGRSLDEWLKFIETTGPKDEVARRDWLKREHGLGTNAAWWIAERSVGKGSEEDTPEGYLRQAVSYVDDMYAGGKSQLRPVHDALIRAALELGEIEICPCKTIVPLYRGHVFAQIKPTTRTRIDLGLCLRGYTKKLPALVIPTGGAEKGDRITHRIEITSQSDITLEVKSWLRTAYELET